MLQTKLKKTNNNEQLQSYIWLLTTAFHHYLLIHIFSIKLSK